MLSSNRNTTGCHAINVPQRRLAIIPARSGSKRLPEKNIRLFCGLPMIGHILSTAQRSGLFTTIHLSTDSESFAEVATGLGFRPDFPRPAHLADDHTPLLPVLRYVTEQYQQRGLLFDQVWLLMACAPLIEVSDLLAAAQLYEQLAGQRAIMSIGRYAMPIQRAYRRDQQGLLTPLYPESIPQRTQDLEPSYFDAGAFIAFPAARILTTDGVNDGSGFAGYLLPRYKAIDIDDEEDWQLAESLYRLQHGQV
ncbi:MAG: acylneuraminate cytidylyltransferase family protein [Magnetococcales bacterium]|nr:acylneuraminate cytidylyltransferase family protein [Magnetococcales bacterium]